MNIFNQHEIGIAGFALLKNWLVGRKGDNEHIYKELRTLLSYSKKITNKDNISKYDVQRGYELWAETYDFGSNLLIEVEQPIVESILKTLPKGKYLDAACGTGRYTNILKRLGNESIGYDQSNKMLKIAINKYPNINFIQGDILNLPFGEDEFDGVVCSLALTHFKDMKPVLRQFYKTIKPNGYLVLSDINPIFILLGGQADFVDVNGNHGYIKNYIHWHNTYLKAFEEIGFEIVLCEEPLVEQKHIKGVKSGFQLSEQTLKSAFQDIPIALIWKLKKK